MKRLAVLPLLITLCCGLISSGEVDVIQEAKAKTDIQIESTYRQAPVDPVVDAIRYNFRELRNLIDSLNVETLLAIQRADSASMQRDSANAVILALIADNTQLKAKTAEYEQDFRVIAWGPNLIMIMVGCFIATLMSHGAYEAWKRRNAQTTHEKE